MSLPVYIRAAATPHAEAQDWAVRVIAAGGGVSSSTLKAVSRFCCAIDTAGIRASMYRLNLFAGSDLLSSLVPLYRGPTFGGTNLGNAIDANTNFVPVDYRERAGLKGNGTSYLNTGVGSNAIPSMFSSHISLSATNMESIGAANQYIDFIGTFGGTSDTTFWLQNNSNVNRYAGLGSFSSFNFGFNATEAHMIGSRTSSTLLTSYRSGVSIGTDGNISVNGRVSSPILVFNRASHTGPGPGGGHTRMTARLYSFGTGLNATQAAAFSAAVIQFNTALGRA